LHRNELEFTYEFIGNFHGKIGKLLTTTQHNSPPSHENNDAYVIYWTPLTPQVQNAIYFGMAYGDRRTPKTKALFLINEFLRLPAKFSKQKWSF
jgi:hypothetical protein